MSIYHDFLNCDNKRVVQKLCNCEMRVTFQDSLFYPSSSIVPISEADDLLAEGCEALWLVLSSLSQNPRTGQQFLQLSFLTFSLKNFCDYL